MYKNILKKGSNTLFLCVGLMVFFVFPHITSASLFSSDVKASVSTGGSISDATVFSGGNVNINFSTGADTTTSFYRNSDGTYNTITVDNGSSNNNGGGGGGGYSCPGGYTLVGTSCCNSAYVVATANAKGGSNLSCNPPSDPNAAPPVCSSSSNGKGSTVTCTSPTSPSEPPAPVCTTTSDGKGGSSTSCVTPPYTPPPSTPPAIVAPTFVQPTNIDGMGIVASPAIIRYGDSSTISWTGGIATSCTITGHGLSSTDLSGSQDVHDLNGQSMYTLTCSIGTLTQSLTATVRVLPQIQES